MDNEEFLRHRIINLREKNNWTQAQLAKKTGLDNTKLSKIENGTRRVSSDELHKFSEVFEVSADYLLGIENKDSAKSESKTRTLAAHIDDDVSDEDMREILNFIDYVRKRDNKE